MVSAPTGIVQELLSLTSQEPAVLLCAPPPLVHAGQVYDADALRREAADHLVRWPALQVMAEVLIELRAAGVPWWDAAHLRERWPLGERLAWLEQREDLRDEIVRSMTGLSLREGRRRSPHFQAELIDAVLDPAADAYRLEAAFDPRDVVVYGPVSEIWDEVVAAIPWGAELPPGLVERLLAILVADRSPVLGTSRPAILTPLQLRSAIDTRAWQAHLPARVRAAVDDARLIKELVEPGVAFTARDELDVVTIGVIAATVPLRSLRPVFTAAARIMGVERPIPLRSQPAATGTSSFAEVANDADVEVTVSA